MSTKHLVVIPLGTGGGVVWGPHGDTNFAILHDVLDEELPGPPVGWSLEECGDEPAVIQLLSTHPFWLIDCGPLTAAWMCGATSEKVTEKLSSLMVKNLKGIVFTHAHSDHMGGLLTLLWRCIFVERTRPTIIAHYECEAAMRRMTDEVRYWNGAQLCSKCPTEGFANQPSKYRERFRPELEMFAQLNFVPTGYQLQTPTGIALVDLFRVDHNIDGLPAFGVRVAASDTTLIFSGDSARPIFPGPPPHAVVFHDCQTYNLDRDSAIHCHLDWLEKAVPKKSRKRVRLVHTRNKPKDCKGFYWDPRFSLIVF